MYLYNHRSTCKGICTCTCNCESSTAYYCICKRK